jgi:hypothetical protein
MTFPSFVSGEVLRATDMNAVGLWLVKTQTVGAGVSTQNVLSCFSADYDNYIVAYSGITCTGGGGAMYMKLLVGSTPQTSGWYGNTFFIGNGLAGALSNAVTSNASFCEVGCNTSTTNFRNASVANIQAPFLTQQTRSQFMNADDYFFRMGAFQLSNTTSYDGLQLLPSTGTMTGGTIRVYGMKNT